MPGPSCDRWRRTHASVALSRYEATLFAYIWLLSRPVVAANAAVCRLTGFAESELVDTRLGWLEESTTLTARWHPIGCYA